MKIDVFFQKFLSLLFSQQKNKTNRFLLKVFCSFKFVPRNDSKLSERNVRVTDRLVQVRISPGELELVRHALLTCASSRLVQEAANVFRQAIVTATEAPDQPFPGVPRRSVDRDHAARRVETAGCRIASR